MKPGLGAKLAPSIVERRVNVPSGKIGRNVPNSYCNNVYNPMNGHRTILHLLSFLKPEQNETRHNRQYNIQVHAKQNCHTALSKVHILSNVIIDIGTHQIILPGVVADLYMAS